MISLCLNHSLEMNSNLVVLAQINAVELYSSKIMKKWQSYAQPRLYTKIR